MNDNEEVAYELNEAQTLLLCMKADTPKAAEIQAEMIAVFRAVMHGWPIPACPHWQEVARQFE
jgi:hypothetical protein